MAFFSSVLSCMLLYIVYDNYNKTHQIIVDNVYLQNKVTNLELEMIKINNKMNNTNNLEYNSTYNSVYPKIIDISTEYQVIDNNFLPDYYKMNIQPSAPDFNNINLKNNLETKNNENKNLVNNIGYNSHYNKPYNYLENNNLGNVRKLN